MSKVEVLCLWCPLDGQLSTIHCRHTAVLTVMIQMSKGHLLDEKAALLVSIDHSLSVRSCAAQPTL